MPNYDLCWSNGIGLRAYVQAAGKNAKWAPWHAAFHGHSMTSKDTDLYDYGPYTISEISWDFSRKRKFFSCTCPWSHNFETPRLDSESDDRARWREKFDGV